MIESVKVAEKAAQPLGVVVGLRMRAVERVHLACRRGVYTPSDWLPNAAAAAKRSAAVPGASLALDFVMGQGIVVFCTTHTRQRFFSYSRGAA